MRLREFSQDSGTSELTSQIISVIEFLRNRAHDKKIIPTVTTSGLINMINNQSSGGVLNYEVLKQMCDSDQTLKSLVTSVDRDSVSLAPFGDEPDAPQDPEEAPAGEGGAKDPTAIVDKMADKARSKRSDLA